MSPNHAEKADAALAELEAQLQALQTGVPEEPAPAATEEAQQTPEAQTETVSSSPVVETETQEQTTAPDPEPTFDVDYWMKKGKEKRDKELEAGMTKAFQEKKELEKALEAERSKATEIEALKAQIEELKASLTKPAAPAVPAPELDLDPDFEENYPDVARQMKALAAKIAAQAAAPVQAVTAQLEEQRKREAAELQKAEAARHFATVQAAHPDAGKFFAEDGLCDAIHAWAETKAPVVRDILINPPSRPAEDLIWVLNEFKREAGLANQQKPKAKPVTGDLAIKTGSPTTPAPVTDPDFFTEQELKNYDSLFNKAMAIRDPELRRAKLLELDKKLTNTTYRNQA